MEGEGEIPEVANSIIQEVDKKEPLLLRFHHLKNLLAIEFAYNKGADPNSEGFVPFDNLYQQPERVNSLTSQVAADWFKTLSEYKSGNINEGDSGMSKSDAQEYANDFIGDTAEDAANFIKAFPKAINTLLSARPEEKVELTMGVDLICNSCQGSGTNMPGEHCIRPPVIEKPNDDNTYYKAVEQYKTTNSAQDTQTDIEELTDPQGRHAFRLSMGTLRSHKFLYDTMRSHYQFKLGGNNKSYPISQQAGTNVT